MLGFSFVNTLPGLCIVHSASTKRSRQTHEAGNKRDLQTVSRLQYGNAARNLICAFHALSLLSLIYPTWCVGVYGCEICFPTVAGIPHCSCQQEGENVWHDAPGFSRLQAPTKQIQKRRLERGVALSIHWLCSHHDMIISWFWVIISVTIQREGYVMTLRWLWCLEGTWGHQDKNLYNTFSTNEAPHFLWYTPDAIDR